jgi:anti-sigma regulatory factor (Ser/Thr protein kinase)
MTSIPSSPREARWELPADPSVMAKCRAMVREALAEWRLPDLIDDVVVVVTELLGNAIIHGGPPIRVVLTAGEGTVTGSVTDGGAGWPRFCTAGTELEHGRGLRIVAALTERWGVEPVPSGAGKTIWFTCARHPSEAARPPSESARPPSSETARGPSPGTARPSSSGNVWPRSVRTRAGWQAAVGQ